MAEARAEDVARASPSQSAEAPRSQEAPNQASKQLKDRQTSSTSWANGAPNPTASRAGPTATGSASEAPQSTSTPRKSSTSAHTCTSNARPRAGWCVRSSSLDEGVGSMRRRGGDWARGLRISMNKGSTQDRLQTRLDAVQEALAEKRLTELSEPSTPWLVRFGTALVVGAASLAASHEWWWCLGLAAIGSSRTRTMRARW